MTLFEVPSGGIGDGDLGPGHRPAHGCDLPSGCAVRPHGASLTLEDLRVDDVDPETRASGRQRHTQGVLGHAVGWRQGLVAQAAGLEPVGEGTQHRRLDGLGRDESEADRREVELGRARPPARSVPRARTPTADRR